MTTPAFSTKAERWTLALLVLLLLYPAWVRGGTYVPFQPPMALLGLLLGAGIFFLPVVFRRAGSAGSALAERWHVMRRDPIFYFGAAFLALILVQLWNAGRHLEFDQVRGVWIYSEPRVPWLPSAVKAGDVRQMLYWFLPAWTVLLAVRSGLLGRRSHETLFCLLAVNGALLSFFGIIEYATRTSSMYWCMPMANYFFASFGYASHAGAFFILTFCVSVGLLLHQLFSRAARPASGWGIAALLVIVLLNLAGAPLCLSVTPMLLAWLLAGLALVYAGWRAWHRLRPAGRANLLAAALGLLLLTVFAVYGLARTRPELFGAEMADLGPGQVHNHLVEQRGFLMFNAARMWRDHPLFGVGAWGFRYFLGLYLPPSQWHKITEGTANVHNDALQFLAEFGLVGAGLMFAVVVVLARPVLRSGVWRRTVAFMPLVGLAAVWSYSLMDIPFRSPAVLYLWLVMLAALPGFVLREDMTEGEHHEP